MKVWATPRPLLGSILPYPVGGTTWALLIADVTVELMMPV